MGTLSGEVMLSFTYLFPFSKGSYSQRKEFALLEQILSFKSKNGLKDVYNLTLYEERGKNEKKIVLLFLKVYIFT